MVMTTDYRPGKGGASGGKFVPGLRYWESGYWELGYWELACSGRPEHRRACIDDTHTDRLASGRPKIYWRLAIREGLPRARVPDRKAERP